MALARVQGGPIMATTLRMYGLIGSPWHAFLRLARPDLGVCGLIGISLWVGPFLIGQNQPTRPNATGGQLVDIIAKLTHDELICVFQINQLDQLNSNSTIVVTIATTIIVVGKFDPTTP